MSRWEYNQLRQCQLFDRGIDYEIAPQRELRKNDWEKIKRCHNKELSR